MGLFVYIVGLAYVAYLSLMTLIGYALPPYELPSVFEPIWPVAILIILFFIRQKMKNYSFPLSCDLILKNRDIALVFVAILAVRLFYIQDRSIWLDEDAQSNSAVTNYFISGAAGLYQPPSDFVFTRVGVLLSSFSVWGLRLHAALFSSLAVASLYFFVKRISNSVILAIGLSFLFAFNTVVFRFGFEARPISHGLFLELLFLMGYFSVLNESENSYLADKPWFLTIITFLYLCSLGLQPVFVVTGAFVFTYFYGFANRAVVKKTLHPMFYGMIAFIPIQLATYKLADARFTKVGLFNMEAFLNQLGLIHYGMISQYVRSFLLSFIVLTVLYLVSAIYKKSFKLGSDFFFVFTAFFFTTVLMAYFDSHIAWYLNEYYLVSVLPLAIFALAVSFRQAQMFIRLTSTQLSVAAITVLAFCSWSYSWAPFKNISEVYAQNDMKSGYAAIQLDSPIKPVVLALCFQKQPGWCAPFLIGEKYYASQNGGHETKVAKNSMDLLQSVQDFSKISEVYFIYYNSWSGPAPKEFSEERKFASFYGIDLYKMPGGKNVFQNIISFLKPAFDAELKRGRLHTYALEYILFAYERAEDKAMLITYLKIFKEFQGEKYGTTYVSNLLVQNGL